MFIPVGNISRISSIAKFSKFIPEEFLTAINLAKQEAKQGIKAGLLLISEMAGVFKKGANEIITYFSKLIDNILAWFKKNVKVFEKNGDQLQMEIYKLLSKFYKKEILINATNGSEIVCFSYRKGLIAVDKIFLYARGKTKSVSDLQKFQEELRQLKNFKQTSRKEFDRDATNLLRLQKLEKEVENALKSLNNMKALVEKAGLIDNVAENKLLFDFLIAIANKNYKYIKPGIWHTSVFKGPKGKVTILTQWTMTKEGQLYLKTIKIF